MGELELEIGARLRGPDRDLWHVRGFVDDQVVLRTWFGARWSYKLERLTSVFRLYKAAK